MTPENVNVADEAAEQLDELIASYLEAEAAGRAPDRQELLERHPALRERLGRFFANQDRFERLAVPLRGVAKAVQDAIDTPRTAAAATTETLADVPGASLGNYELFEVIGRGGMGIVYKARQKTPARLVALKRLRRDDPAGPDLARFRNEAETVAQLDHPHIVPVYEVGEAAGELYFSMKLLEGGSLAGQLARFGADPRAAAELVAAVARAIHHAHQRGVLHRDLKPSNILLDADGQPHVTDFGLAKWEGAETSLTETGAILGTPGYLAPEQAVGKRGLVTVAVDVYGLGAVLYTSLTGKPPFQGDTVLDTLAHVREREPQPPSGSNPKVDRDLETVCLKCLRKEPERRYRSAVEVAEDLERYLAGEPILARRIGIWERLGKWARRRPALVGLVVVTALATLTLVAGLVWHNAELKAAALREHEQAQQALWQQQQAEANSQEAQRQRRLARAAVDDMYTQVAEKWLANQPQMESVQREFLQKALRFYEQVSQENSTDPSVRLETARAYRRVGNIHGSLGGEPQAEKALQQAIDRLERLAEEFPHVPEYRQHLAGALLDLADLPRKTVRFTEVEKLGRRALTLLEQLVADSPAVLAYHRDLGRGYSMEGHKLRILRRHSEADQVFRLALALQKKLVAESPSVPDDREDLALTLNDFASNLLGLGQPGEAQKTLGEAVALAEKLVADFPGVPRYGKALADVYGSLGGQLPPGEAEPFLRRALALQRKLAVDFPGATSYRYILSRSLQDLGNLLLRTQRAEEAEKAFREAVAIGDKLAADAPAVKYFRDRLALGCTGLADVLTQTGRLAQAAAAQQRAVDLLETVIAEFPDTASLLPRLLASYFSLAELLALTGRPEAALDIYAKAVERAPTPAEPLYKLAWFLVTCADEKVRESGRALLKEAIRRRPDSAEVHTNLGTALTEKGQLDEAIAAHQEAIRLKPEFATAHTRLGSALAGTGQLEEAIAAHQEAIRLQPDFPEAHRSLGKALVSTGHLNEAIAEFRQALRCPDNWKPSFAGSHMRLGSALAGMGQLEEAIAAFEEAIRLQPDLAEAHNNLGVTLRDKGRLDAAAAEFREALRLQPDYPKAFSNLGQTERLIALGARLPRLLKGGEQPADSAERLTLASLYQQQNKQCYAAAVGRYAEAFAAEPRLASDLSAGHRYNAAGAAALAGCGQGKNANELGGKERTRLRRQALDWLHADLVAWREQLDKDPDKARSLVWQHMQHWHQDADFAGLRGADALGRLPEVERKAWQQLWQDVEALRQQAAGPPTPFPPDGP